jgi:trehalose/maltose transport system substrate-binding protein
MVLVLFASCSARVIDSKIPPESEQEQPVLSMMSLLGGPSEDFETKTLRLFAAQHGFHFQHLPTFESDDGLIALPQELLRKHSTVPDLLEMDIIWPSNLSEDLLDLTPYLGAAVSSFPPELIQPFTFKGRLIAVPLLIDTGLLYYRSDLLEKYGFRSPPKTWIELEAMSKVIQRGERRAGNKNFWGFVWQGRASEGLTCNALEWFGSQAGNHILEPDGTVRVCDREVVRALERAVSWIGTISPPGVIAYDVDDSFNVWKTGNAAFMRNWGYVYGFATKLSCPVHDRFGVSTLPGGDYGTTRTLGGIAVTVSRYSGHREQAVAALRYLVSAEVESLRTIQTGTLPPMYSLQQRGDLMKNTPFHDALAGKVMTGVVARPAALAGASYERVSHAFSEAVHAALARQASPAQSLHHLEDQLVEITGFRPAANL